MYDSLLKLFIWQNNEQVYRVRFADGEVYDLSHCFAGTDEGEALHATASIVTTLKSKNSRTKETGTAIFFRLSEIAEVTDVETGIVQYKAF